MEKIGWGQLGISLALTRLISEAASFPGDGINYGMQRFTVIFLSYVLLAAALIPLFIFIKKRPGEDIFSAAAKKSRAAAGTLAVVYLAALLIMMTGAAAGTQFYSSSTIFDAAPAGLLILFIFIACAYGTAKGLPAVVRAGVIAACGFAAALLLVIIGVWRDIDPYKLYPALIDRPERLFGEVLAEFSKNAEAAVFIPLCSRVRKGAEKSLFLYGGLSLFSALIMTFLYDTVLGEYLSVTNFPFYKLASLSDIGILQRSDGIDAAVWTVAAVIRLSLMAAAVRGAVLSAFGNRKAAGISAFAALAVSAGAGLILSGHTTDLIRISSVSRTGAVLFAAVLPLPLAALFLSGGKKGKEKA